MLIFHYPGIRISVPFHRRTREFCILWVNKLEVCNKCTFRVENPLCGNGILQNIYFTKKKTYVDIGKQLLPPADKHFADKIRAKFIIPFGSTPHIKIGEFRKITSAGQKAHMPLPTWHRRWHMGKTIQVQQRMNRKSATVWYKADTAALCLSENIMFDLQIRHGNHFMSCSDV